MNAAFRLINHTCSCTRNDEDDNSTGPPQFIIKICQNAARLPYWNGSQAGGTTRLNIGKIKCAIVASVQLIHSHGIRWTGDRQLCDEFEHAAASITEGHDIDLDGGCGGVQILRVYRVVGHAADDNQ